MPPLSSRTLAKLKARSAGSSEARAASGSRAALTTTSGGGLAGTLPPVTRDLEVPAPMERVWAGLTDPAAIGAWLTCQDVRFEPRVGGAYRLFDGDATGTVTRFRSPRLLEYTWVMKGWPAGAPPSLVRWDLSPVAGGKRTRLRLTHTRLPDQETRDRHEDGWNAFFLDKLLAWLRR